VQPPVQALLVAELREIGATIFGIASLSRVGALLAGAPS